MWMMQFMGTKAAVKTAIIDYSIVAKPQRTKDEERAHLLLDAPPEELAPEEVQLARMKEQACSLIDLLPPTQNGVDVRIAGSGNEIIVFHVEGRYLTL